MAIITYKRGFYFLSILLLFTSIVIHAQEKTIDTSDLITYKAPSKNYNPIYLQSYKGFPRFGIPFNYMKPEVNKIESREKLRLTQKGNANYDKLIRLKYSPSINENIIGTVGTVGSDELLLKYLCNPKDLYSKGCTTEALNRNIRIIGGSWGGLNANEFDQKRSYAEFVKEGLDKELKKWSNSFFTNDSEIVYNVSRTIIRNYDFEKGGYPISITLGGKGSPRSKRLPFMQNFIPIASYEKELINQTPKSSQRVIGHSYNSKQVNTLFKLSPEKAEELTKKNISSVYLVSKVKIIYKGTTENKYNNSSQLSFEYHFESPTIEFFEDIGLTQKLGEISLDKI